MPKRKQDDSGIDNLNHAKAPRVTSSTEPEKDFFQQRSQEAFQRHTALQSEKAAYQDRIDAAKGKLRAIKVTEERHREEADAEEREETMTEERDISYTGVLNESKISRTG
ncbi:hypothetical protein MBLNU230_g6544t1 [Neophaeotheca triangularis]